MKCACAPRTWSRNGASCPLYPQKADIPVSIDQSCPRRLAVREQTLAGALAVMEPGQVSERVFSTLPFLPASPSSSPSSFAPGHRALLSWISSPRSISRIGIMPRRHSHLSSRTHRLTNMAISIIPKSRSEVDRGPMSALPPKADMCGANRDVRYGPKADIRAFLLALLAAEITSLLLVKGNVRHGS